MRLQASAADSSAERTFVFLINLPFRNLSSIKDSIEILKNIMWLASSICNIASGQKVHLYVKGPMRATWRDDKHCVVPSMEALHRACRHVAAKANPSGSLHPMRQHVGVRIDYP